MVSATTRPIAPSPSTPTSTSPGACGRRGAQRRSAWQRAYSSKRQAWRSTTASAYCAIGRAIPASSRRINGTERGNPGIVASASMPAPRLKIAFRRFCSAKNDGSGRHTSA